MEDSSMFIQWAMNTLLDEPPPPAVDDGCCVQATFQSLQPLPQASYPTEPTMFHDAFLPLPNSVWHGPTGGGSNLPVTRMNFSAAVVPASGDGMPETSTTTTTQGLPQPAAYGSLPRPAPVRRAAGIKSSGSASTSPATYAHKHTIAERKRREKINQRFVELSAVIPDLKKMDKATILSDATRYVKELQEKLNAWEVAGSGVVIRSSGENMAVARKRECYAAPDKEGFPLGAPAAKTGKPLPEIEAQLCGKNVMVRVLCENGKGVVARVLAEVEDLHLRIVDANATITGLHSEHNHHGKGGGGLHCHSGGDHWPCQLCIITTQQLRTVIMQYKK